MVIDVKVLCLFQATGIHLTGKVAPKFDVLPSNVSVDFVRHDISRNPWVPSILCTFIDVPTSMLGPAWLDCHEGPNAFLHRHLATGSSRRSIWPAE